MNYILLALISLFLHGCFYFNDEGISTKLYSECKEYYDADGNYKKECPKNLVNYSDLDK